MKKIFLILLCISIVFSAVASHELGGEITYRPVNNLPGCLDYDITVVTYTDYPTAGGAVPVDRCSVTVQFGDGTKAIVNRSNAIADSDPQLGYLCGQNIGGGHMLGSGFPNVKKNTYRVRHSYLKEGTYTIRIVDMARVYGLCNVTQSLIVSFALRCELSINSWVSGTSIPEFGDLSVDNACVGYPSYHQIKNSNPDGDSLVYSIIPLMDSTGHPDPSYTMPPVTPGGGIWIDPNTGGIGWINPPSICVYLLCVRMEVWKKFQNIRFFTGYVERNIVFTTQACTILAGITEAKAEVSIARVYPNPASGADLSIEWDTQGVEGPAQLDIFDISGRLLISGKYEAAGKIHLSAPDLQAGSYYLMLQTSDKVLRKGRFCIAR